MKLLWIVLLLLLFLSTLLPLSAANPETDTADGTISHLYLPIIANSQPPVLPTADATPEFSSVPPAPIATATAIVPPPVR